MMRMARNGLLLAPLKFGFGSFNRFLSAMKRLEKLHERDVPERHGT